MGAPTNPDGVVARPGTWAKIGLPDPMIRPPRRKHNGIWPGNMMCDARSSGLDRRQGVRTGIGRDYTTGQEGVLAFKLVPKTEIEIVQEAEKDLVARHSRI